jgi:hypothetical protein
MQSLCKVYAKHMQSQNMTKSGKNTNGRQLTLSLPALLGGGGGGRCAQLAMIPRSACASGGALQLVSDAHLRYLRKCGIRIPQVLAAIER